MKKERRKGSAEAGEPLVELLANAIPSLLGTNSGKHQSPQLFFLFLLQVESCSFICSIPTDRGAIQLGLNINALFNSKGFVLEQPLEKIKDVKGIHPQIHFSFPLQS